MSTERLATVGSYDRIDAARAVKRLLEDGGVPAFIHGEALALVANRPGLLTVEVAETDLEHAQRILTSAHEDDAEDGDEANDEESYYDEESYHGFDVEAVNEASQISIAVFYDSIEAELATNLLRKAGLRYRLRTSLRTFQLLVEEQLADRACRLLGLGTQILPDESDLAGPDEPGVVSENITTTLNGSPTPTWSSNVVARRPPDSDSASDLFDTDTTEGSFKYAAPTQPADEEGGRSIWFLLMIVALGLCGFIAALALNRKG